MNNNDKDWIKGMTTCDAYAEDIINFIEKLEEEMKDNEAIAKMNTGEIE